jgi:hypothetical protein
MSYTRVCNGVEYTFDNAGYVINAFGERQGPTEADVCPVEPPPPPPPPTGNPYFDAIHAQVDALYVQLLGRHVEEPTGTIDTNAIIAGTFSIDLLRAQILASPEYAALHPPAPPPPPAPPATHDLSFRLVGPDGAAVAGVAIVVTFGTPSGAAPITDATGIADAGQVAAGAAATYTVQLAPPNNLSGTITMPASDQRIALQLGTPPFPPPPPPTVPPSVPIGSPTSITPPPPVRSIEDLAATAHAFDINVGGGFGSIIGGIISGIAALFGGGAAGDISKLNDRVTSLGNFVLKAISALTSASNYNVAGEQIGGTLWAKIFSGIFGPIVGLLSGLIHGASADLGKLLGPLSSYLGKLRDLVRRVYDNWLRPILHVIDVTRQVLRVLAALHIELAAAADRALGRLEGKLTAPLLLATRKINELSNQVNRIVTLDGALQRVTLLRGLVKHSACVQRAVLNTWIADSSTVPDVLPAAAPAPTIGALVDDYRTFVQTGTSEELDDYDDWAAELQADLESTA